MSKTIDQRVVEMQFDNRHFEKHTRESMSTLEKLKQKLNFSGASKGLENLNASANKVDMKGMSGALDTVHAKFSAMEVIGVTALANITNSAVEAGKRMVNALTIAPVTDGWQEYEMTLNSIQTTMAGTGKTAEEVEKELKKLDEYADKTVYSTADMLNNLPKFTNAGVELEDATKAMIGIANATALAGGDAGKASIAFYNLGQAIGTGYLTRMDYNSINNAGIATMEWKNQMVEAAIAAGTLKKVGEDSFQAGNKTLTLQQLFIDGLQEQWATTDVMMKVFGDYGDETTEIGKKSYAAAQDIKTFSMMMDSLKATAGTGWKDTWQIIFGGLDEAKEFWTGLTNFISGIITGMADFRNWFLDSALNRGFKKLGDTLKTVTKPITKTVDAVEKATSALKDLDTMVTEVIRGNWGNGQTRFDKLTEAGYNYYAIQNKVNETLGSSFRYSDELAGAQVSLNKAQEQGVETQKELTKEQIENIETLANMSKKELEALGYTKEQIEAFKELKKYSDMTGLSIADFIANIDEIDGRWLLINSFKNAGQGLVAVFTALKDAWLEIFKPNPEGLFNLIAGLHKFSTYLTVSERAAKNLKDTFKGVFAILDMVTTIIAAPIKIAFKLLMQFFKALDIGIGGILEITGSVGRAVTAFHDWFEEVFDFTEVFKFLAPYIKKGAKAIGEWFKGLKDTEAIQRFVKFLKESKEAIVEWIKGIKDAKNIPKYIFEGLMNGLSSGVKGVINFVIGIGTQILDAIKNVLGIHSPSTEFYEIGKNIMQGLFNGLSAFVKMVYNLVISIGSKLIDIIRNLDIGSIFTILTGAGITYAFIKIAKAIDALTGPLESVDYLIEQTGKTMKSFRGVLKSLKLKIMAESIKTMAVAVAILAGSLVVLTFVDQGKLWSAVGAIGVLMILLAGLTAIAGKFGGKQSLEFGKISLALLGLAFAMAIMAKALKTIGSIKPEQYLQAIKGFLAIVTTMIVMMSIVSSKRTNLTKVGSAFMGMAFAILMMSMVAKSLGKMDEHVLKQGIQAITAFGLIIVGLMAATRLIGGSLNVDGIGKSISKIAGAMLLMMIVAKIAGNMLESELKQGLNAIIAFGGIIVGLMAATKLIGGGKNVDKIGKTIFGVAGAMLMMVLVAKIASSMDVKALAKGIIAITAFGGIIVGLIAATKLVGGDANVAKIGRTIFMLSFAIGVMGITAALLGMINVKNLAKGVTAVGFLAGMMAILIYVTKSVPQGIMGSLITLTVSIGVIALAIAGLSMIDGSKLAGATIAIGALLGMFALVMKMSGFVTKSMGTLIVLTVAIGLIAGALYLIATLPIEKSLGAAAALSMLLLSLSVSLVILGLVGSLGPAAFIGIAALATLIAGIGGLIVGIGALFNKFPMLEEFLDKGIPVLEKIGYALGSFVGNIIGGFMAGALSGLPAIGTSLSQFMTNATPFIDGAKKIDKSLVSGVTSLAGAILIITATDVLNSLTSWLTGGNSISEFGSQLGELANSLNNFASNLDTFDESKVTSIKCASNAIKSLAEAASMIPNEGGLWAKIAGENSLVAFGSKLPTLAIYLNGFVSNLGTFDESKVTTIDCAAKAIKTLAQAANEIPNEGGLWAVICGDNSLATFGSQLPGLGMYLNGFVRNLGTFNEAQVTTIDCAGKAIKALATAAKEIPNEGGLWAAICGDNSLATFGENLPALGTNIMSFVKNLGTFSEAQVQTVNSACNAIKSLAKLGEIDIKDTGKDMKSFGKNMIEFAKKVKDFVKEINDVGSSSIESAIKKTKEILDLAKNVVSIDAKTLSTFGNSLKDIAKNGVKGFVKEFSGQTAKSDAEKAAKKLLDAAIDGAGDKQKDAEKEFKKIAEAAVKKLCTKELKEDAKQAGKDLVTGFANGIKDNKYLAENAGNAIGKAALKAAKEAIDSHSPSKEAMKIGNYFGQGLVIGIKDYETKTYNAGFGIADYARKGLSKAITKISNIIDSDIDAQPTIRPVLDLSDVESGAGYLNSMFNNQSIGVNSNLNAISLGMSSINQNGTNSDVVTAINKLRKDLSNVGGTTYNVNGVTYDDGSNITEAVRTIVRAAKVERRI